MDATKQQIIKDFSYRYYAIRNIFVSLTLKNNTTGIGEAQLEILNIINQCELNSIECNVNTLSKSIDSSASALTQIVDRLVKNNLVNRVHSQTDRRKVIMTLTPQAQEKLKRYNVMKQRFREDVFGILTEEEIKLMSSLFDKVIQNQKQSL